LDELLDRRERRVTDWTAAEQQATDSTMNYPAD